MNALAGRKGCRQFALIEIRLQALGTTDGWEAAMFQRLEAGKHLGGLGNHPEHVQHWNLRSFEKFLGAVVPQVRIIEAFPWIIACCRPKQP